MRLVCHCACHRGSSILAFTGANVTDPVEAAAACDSCRDSHCAVLLSKRLANDPLPEPPQPVLMVAWQDSPPDQPTERTDDGN